MNQMKVMNRQFDDEGSDMRYCADPAVVQSYLRHHIERDNELLGTTPSRSRDGKFNFFYTPPLQNKKLHPCDITLYQDVYINNNKSTSIKELNMFISSARKLISLKKDKEKNLTSYLHSRRRCNIYLYYECNEA